MMKVSPFRKMTLTALLLPFYKVHLNLLKYEKKPLDAGEKISRQIVPERKGDPTISQL